MRSTTAFESWAQEWLRLGSYSGPHLGDVDARIESIVNLWHQPVPGGWERDDDPALLDPSRRYRRSHPGRPGGPVREALIEHEVLSPSPAVTETTCLGFRLVDGVNAVSLQRSRASSRRSGNVEADMLLLTQDAVTYRALLVEVKVTSDTPWFAAVENLRQLRLYLESPAAQRLLPTRQQQLRLPDIPVTGVVLAPATYYTAPVKKAASVAPTRKLMDRMRAVAGHEFVLATWNSERRVIEQAPSDNSDSPNEG
jgi:hypothetical protein